MVTIKVICVCGQKYAFDVEPAQGRMPFAVQCPICKTDGTQAANEILAGSLPQPAQSAAIAAPVPAAGGGIRISGLPPGMTPPPPSAGTLRVSGGSPNAPAASSDTIHLSKGEFGGLLDRNIFFIKERTGMLKLTDTYDIFDPATKQQIGVAKEEPPVWAKWLRLVVQKSRMPTVVNIYEREDMPPVLTMKRGFTLFRQKLRVIKGNGFALGYFRSKVISIGGGFHVFDNHDQAVAEVKGNWKGWDFKFVTKAGREIGSVTKKWAGLGKELFSTADNYVISLSDVTAAGPNGAALLLAAGLAIDIVFKEAD